MSWDTALDHSFPQLLYIQAARDRAEARAALRAMDGPAAAVGLFAQGGADKFNERQRQLTDRTR